ncbi:MAG TPA: carbohydrate-binding family 9-like protein [Chthoniobacteraceae bacterium]|nr:carbohydrate-binding family 9-like protein [Chthoniobacteraceae bacterium]
MLLRRLLPLTVAAAALFHPGETASAQDAPASPQYAAMEVPPYRLIAADFARVPRQIVNDAAAYDGRILRQSARLMLLDLPFPRTSEEITVYVKVRAESPKDSLALTTFRGGERVPLATLSQQTPGKWVWVRLPAIRGEAIGERLRLDAAPSREFGRSIALESIVISTDAELSDEALEATAPLLPSHPLAVVNPTDTPPSLDGRGTDAVWKKAIAIRDFLAFSTGVPARLGTTVRFLYDEAHLYVQFVVDEPLLRAADMRMEELFARATERDQTLPHGILSDDACLLMLQPEKDGPVYEWTTNTLGALLDARMDPSDLWATRDVKWNAGGVTSKVERREAGWVWEMAIPLADLGVKAPQPGETWNVALARLSPSRKESSAWNPTGRGAHRPEKWGQLRFGTVDTAALTPREPLAELAPGSNRIDLDLVAEKGSVPVIATALAPEGGLPLVAQSAVPTTEEATHATHRFEVHETVPTLARWGLFNAAMQPYYVSPQATIAVRSTVLTLTLSTPGAYEVVVNDSVVATGASADGEKIRLAMRHGANPIAIRAEAGVAALRLEGAGSEAFPQLWRAKAESDPKATAADFDDRQWPLLATKETVGDQKKGEPLVLRRIVLSEQTQIWPVPSPALFVAANSSQPATFKFNGLPGRDLADWVTWVAVPETLEVTGVSSFYGTVRPRQPVFSVERDGTTEIEGKTLPLYRITADKPLFYDEAHPPGGRTGIFHLMLRVAKGAPKAPVTERLYYWSQAEKGGVSEMTQSLTVETVPPLNGKQPGKFVFELWGSNLGTLDSIPVREQAMETMKAAGFNLLVDSRDWAIENGPRFGLTIRPTVKFVSWSINLNPFLKEHPDERLLDHHGKRSDQWLCTTQLLGERWPVVSEVFADQLRKLKATTVCYDYEFSTLTGPHSCFCERCLAAFRKEKKIAGDQPLTPETIETRHRAAWDDFMARRGARLLAKMKETVHATIPGGLFTVFSLPQSPRTVSVYGIDWRYVAGTKGADVIQIGTSGGWREMLHTSEVAGDLPIMYGVWITPYGPDHMIPARVADKAELLRRVLDSTHGILFYDRATMDGRSWWNVGETTRLVADFEELFLHSRPEPVEGHDPERVQWLRGKKKQLLCIMNRGDAAADFSVALPEKLANGYDYYTGAKVGETETLHATVPANETAVYVFDVR